MIEVAILEASAERLLSIVICTIPLDCEVDILRDVTTEREHSVVAHSAGDVELVVDHRRCACPAITRHKVKVTLDRCDWEAIADVCTQRCRAIHILVCRVLQWVVLCSVDGDSLRVVDNRLTNIVLRDVT